jgi:hypothetical protein
VATAPDTIQMMLTDNGLQGTNRQREHDACQPRFDRLGHEQGMEHRRTQGKLPWTTGQMECRPHPWQAVMVQKCDSQPHQHRKAHLPACPLAAHGAKHRNTRSGLTPYGSICHSYTTPH